MITIFTPSFADEAGTNAQNLSVKEIVSRLDPQRASVTMFHDGVVDPRIAARPNTSLIAWRKRGNTLQAIWEILKRRPDVYFFPREGPLDAAFLKLRRHLRLKTALVTYVVSGGLYSQPYAPARVNNIREGDVVVSNNRYLSQLLKEKMGIDADVIYDGVDRRYFFAPPSRRSSAKPLVVLYAGSLRPYKRAPLVIEQAARWPQVRFRIAGIGEEEKTCKDRVAKLGCRNVEFFGHLTPVQLGDEMRQADVFLFPSIVEGHPQVLLQAAASALPVVAMALYHPDYVIDGTTGLLAESDEDLSQKLDLLIGNPALRRSMGEGAARRAQQFDWDTITAQWQQVFERAVAKSRS